MDMEHGRAGHWLVPGIPRSLGLQHQLEIWTLQPLRTLDDPAAGVVDGDAYTQATASLARHMVVHSVLVLAVFVLARLSETPIPN